MPTIPAGYGQLNFFFAGEACPTGAQITLGWDNASALTAEFAATSATAAWVAHIQDALSEFCTHTGVLAKIGPSATGPSAFVSNASPGAVSGDPEVANTSILVRKVTALGGRAGRGRFFVPGAGQALFQENSRMTPGDDAVYDGLFENFYDALIALDLTPVVLHGPGSPITTPTPITEFRTDSLAATQRRRLRR